ncbi:hypothetical protein KBB96_13640 [Luteolibacter ambystomatis]|uniref:Lipoprotein n=1 Tax=Luteolibacter ambystomatis TaxID=2824561 RepID=A0A975IY63_9BACT|nr:hypothetical protein [Luteolibacter ambystomatis]QUE49907.1 hypothetical protein KBB96_13640 [Luteolibacter ambystomatis]
MRILKAIGGAAMAAVFGGALVSCGPVNRPLTPAALQARGLKPGEGYIVATFQQKTVMPSGKMENLPGAEASVTIKGPTDDTRVWLEPYAQGPGQSVMVKGARSEVLAIPMPAGQYSVTGWSLIGQRMTATVSVSNRLPMNVPFEVKAGEATYVGRVNALTIVGRSLIGIPVFGHGFVIVTDRFAEDQSRIAKTYPTIKSSTIRRSNVPAGYLSEMKRIADTPEESGWKKFLGQ